MKKYIILSLSLVIVLILLCSCSLLYTNLTTERESPIEKDAFVIKNTDKHNFKNENETNLFEIESLKVTTISDKGEVLSPDGTLLATYSYSYPVFESNNKNINTYIEYINQLFKNNALAAISEPQTNLENIIDHYETVKQYGGYFYPYDYNYSYEIHTNSTGILSITEIWYVFMGGAHGSTLKESHTFDIINQKKLQLSDLLIGTDQQITDAFVDKFMEVKDQFFDNPSDIVPKELKKAQYYIDKNGVSAYFQQYQVGPFVSGFVSATISDKDMLKVKIYDNE